VHAPLERDLTDFCPAISDADHEMDSFRRADLATGTDVSRNQQEAVPPRTAANTSGMSPLRTMTPFLSQLLLLCSRQKRHQRSQTARFLLSPRTRQESEDRTTAYWPHAGPPL
jgi:hypothetical protein